MHYFCSSYACHFTNKQFYLRCTNPDLYIMLFFFSSPDGWVRVLRPFNSISVISRRWKDEHERLCAMKCRLGSGRISPPAGFEPATPWTEVGSTNRSATRMLLSSPEPSGSQGELIVYPYSGVRCRCRQKCLNIFSSETALPIKAKFYVEPPWEGGTKVCINGPGHMTKMAAMPIYGKNL